MASALFGVRDVRVIEVNADAAGGSTVGPVAEGQFLAFCPYCAVDPNHEIQP